MTLQDFYVCTFNKEKLIFEQVCQLLFDYLDRLKKVMNKKIRNLVSPPSVKWYSFNFYKKIEVLIKNLNTKLSLKLAEILKACNL